MTLTRLPALLLVVCFLCNAQTAVPADPTLDTSGLPAYLRAIPQPAPEPWRKITEQQRFELFASLSLTPGAGLSALSGAALSQALNSPKEWGQGSKAYGKRVASSYGSSAVAYSITYATSAIFKEDNRYFRSKKNKFGERFAHVIISPYVAHSNSGATHFSASSFLGSAGGSAIPLLWSPRSWQGMSNVAVNYYLWYAGLAGTNLIREFLPDMIRSQRLKHDKKSLPPVPPKK